VAAGKAAEPVVGAVFAGEGDSDYAIGGWRGDGGAVGSAGAGGGTEPVVAVKVAEADVIAGPSAGVAGSCWCHGSCSRSRWRRRWSR
jgi:hypothetical protein